MQQSVKADPRNYKTWVHLGLIWQRDAFAPNVSPQEKKRAFAQAERCYRQAVRIQQTNYEAWLNWGALWHRQALSVEKESKKKYKASLKLAKRLYQRTLQVAPKLSIAYFNLAVIAHKEGELQRAKHLYTRSLMLPNKTYTRSVPRLCSILWKEKQYLKAYKVAKRWLRMYPNTPSIRQWLRSHKRND